MPDTRLGASCAKRGATGAAGPSCAAINEQAKRRRNCGNRVPPPIESNAEVPTPASPSSEQKQAGLSAPHTPSLTSQDLGCAASPTTTAAEPTEAAAA